MEVSTSIYVIDDDERSSRAATAYLRAGTQIQRYQHSRDFLADLDALAPGAVLLESKMPDIDGFALLDAIGQARLCYFPAIVMTAPGEVAAAVRAMKLGASDVMEKPLVAQALCDAVNWVQCKLALTLDAAVDHHRAAELLGRLSRREREVLDGLMSGLPNKAIAFRLNLSLRTVEAYRGNLMRRLEARTFHEVMRIAVAAGVALKLADVS